MITVLMRKRMGLGRALTGGLLLLAALGGCATLAIWSAPEKQAGTQRTELAERADQLFWNTLHNGDYEKIGDALTALTAAYLENPNDAVTAAHVGWMHIWRLSERERLERIPPTIMDDIVLARKYFEESVRLNPKEARFLGFYGSSLLAEGNVHKDEKLTRKGYYTLRDSVAAWPEFNLFTMGYVLSSRPHDSERFAEGLELQWKNLDACVGGTVDRRTPAYARYMGMDTKEGVKRVCWNSWIAPHNFEGFFLNMGDMLVKNGQPDVARTIYANAKLAPEYPGWKFKDVLGARIRDAERNVEIFRKPKPGKDDPRIMVGSTYACMACHQK